MSATDDDAWSLTEFNGDYYPACGWLPKAPDSNVPYRLPTAHDQSLCAVASAWLIVPFVLFILPDYFDWQVYRYDHVCYSSRTCLQSRGPLVVWW